jgi:putative transposase
MRAAYKCRAYPTPDQAAVLNRTFGCVRVAWNQVLAWRHARYHTQGLKTSYAETDRYLTELKKRPEFAWLNEVSSVPLQQTLRHQFKAYPAFFAGRARYPRFKSRSGRQSASYTRSAFRMRDGKLFLAKTDGALPFVWTWPDIDVTTLDPSTVTVTRDAAGRWFVSFALDVDAPTQFAPTGSVIGVDLGLTDFAVTSNGDRIAHPRHMEACEQRLKRYQRMMARRKKGSANRAKMRTKVARAHAKVTDARRDFLHRARSSFGTTT